MTMESLNQFRDAVQSGDVDVVRQHLRDGNIDVDTVMVWSYGYGKRTALMYASIKGHLDIVKSLIHDGNVSVDIQNEGGSTALMCAALNGHLEVVKSLIHKGKAAVDIQDQDGNTALIRASRSGHVDIIKYLIHDGKTSVDIQNKDGLTALHIACIDGYFSSIPIIVCLIESGATLDLTDKNNKKALDYIDLSEERYKLVREAVKKIKTKQKEANKRRGRELEKEKRLSDEDIRDITNTESNLTPAHLNRLSLALGMKINEIEIAKRDASATDVKSQLENVLRKWVHKNGNNATREKLITALEKETLIQAKEYLEQKWGLATHVLTDVTDEDIHYVTFDLSLDYTELHNVFRALDFPSIEVKYLEESAVNHDSRSIAMTVLQEWRMKNGSEASRNKLIDALVKCRIGNAYRILAEAWGFPVSEDEPWLSDSSVITRQQAKFVTNAEETIEVPSGTTLHIPANALPSNERVGIIVSNVWGLESNMNQEDEFAIGSAVFCEPAGKTFDRPVTISVPHSAENITLKDLKVFTIPSKRQAKDGVSWEVFFDGSKLGSTASDSEHERIQITKAEPGKMGNIKLIFNKLAGWKMFSRRSMEMNILTFMHPCDILQAERVYLNVYCVRKDEIKIIEEELHQRIFQECAVKRPVTVTMEMKHDMKFQITIHLPHEWERNDLDNVIPFKQLRSGGLGSGCTSTFVKISKNAKDLAGEIQVSLAKEHLISDKIVFSSTMTKKGPALDYQRPSPIIPLKEEQISRYQRTSSCSCWCCCPWR